ncbi:hypothetical protein F66182_10351 [Fusarium sp. NRRL 66182]|nr:hypothetical protein F66182_10351 [Fusarium sp. NRRL 66182]
MKFTAALLGLLTSHTFAANMYSAPNAEAECGALGVMEWDLDTLPPDAVLGELRKCKEHPLSLNIHSRNLDAENAKVLEKRKCTSSIGKKKYGCDKSWCWMNCGDTYKQIEWGQWCWAAKNGGRGSWWGCNSDVDCPKTQENCAKGDCKQCGCGC